MEGFNEKRRGEEERTRGGHEHVEGSGEGNGERRDEGEEGKKKAREPSIFNKCLLTRDE